MNFTSSTGIVFNLSQVLISLLWHVKLMLHPNTYKNKLVNCLLNMRRKVRSHISLNETVETGPVDFIKVSLHEGIKPRSVDFVKVFLLEKSGEGTAVNFVHTIPFGLTECAASVNT